MSVIDVQPCTSTGGGGGSLPPGDFADIPPAEGNEGMLYYAEDQGVIYRSDGVTWEVYSSVSAGGPPTGAAGGVLSGTYPNPTIAAGAALGTPSALVLTNATGTPASIGLANGTGLPVGGITGLGANVATFLATPSSVNLAAAVTGETGSGALVFGTSPTITTPVIVGPAELTDTASNFGLTITGTAASSSIGANGILIRSNDGAALASGDRYGLLVFGGWDGAAYRNGGGIHAFAAGLWSSNVYPTYLSFETSDGTGARVERMRVGGTSTTIANLTTASIAGGATAATDILSVNTSMRVYNQNQTFTTRPHGPLAIIGTYTLNFANANFGGNTGSANLWGLISVSPQLTAAAAYTGIGSIAFRNNTTIINSGAIVNMGVLATVRATPTTTATGSAIALAPSADFYSAPTYVTAAGGTLNLGADYVHYESLLTGDSGVTVPQWAAYAVLPNTGAAITVETGFRCGNLALGSTSVFGFEVGFGAGAWGGAGINRGFYVGTAPTGGTENTGIYNAGTLRQLAAAAFGASVEPVWGVTVAGSGNLGAVALTETTAPTTIPTDGAMALMYVKADKLIFEWNTGGTRNYLSILLTGSGTTWTHSTAVP